MKARQILSLLNCCVSYEKWTKPSLNPIRTTSPIRPVVLDLRTNWPREWYGPIILKTSTYGVKHDCGIWLFVLVTLSPIEVGALSAQFNQLCDLVPLFMQFPGACPEAGKTVSMDIILIIHLPHNHEFTYLL